MRCVSAIIALGLVAAASAIPVAVRQTQVSQAADVGKQSYERVAGSPNSNCPKNFSHGTYNKNPALERFNNFGVEGAFSFTNINTTGTPCKGDAKNASLVLLSQDELNRLKRSQNQPANFLKLNASAWKKVYLAGLDTEPRKCGNYQASKIAYYAFTKDIGLFIPRLRELNVIIPKQFEKSGERWMISYIPEQNSVCAFIDETTTSYRTAKNITTPLPSIIPATPTSPDTAATPVTPNTPNTPATALEPEESMGPSPSPAQSGSDGSVCFPASATVELADGSVKTMDKVELGDKVKVADGHYSDVFMFTHKMADVVHDFVVLKTISCASLALTHGHYLYVNGALVAAKTVRAGDVIESASGDLLTVASVSVSSMTGLYNPQTVQGDVIVNGIRASTFTTAVHPSAAQALLAPMRGLYARLGFVTGILNQGSDFLANQMPSGAAVVA